MLITCIRAGFLDMLIRSRPIIGFRVPCAYSSEFRLQVQGVTHTQDAWAIHLVLILVYTCKTLARSLASGLYYGFNVTTHTLIHVTLNPKSVYSCEV